MTTITITGAWGHLGRDVVRQAIERGYDVVALDVVPPPDDAPTVAEAVQLDLTDARRTADAVRGDAVIHLAAYPAPGSVPDAHLFHVNTQSTWNVLEAAANRGMSQAAIASSGSIYGMAWSPRPITFERVPVIESHPLNIRDVYALSKQINERTAAMFCRQHGMSIAALRFHWIATPEQQRLKAEAYRKEPYGEDAYRNLWGYVDLRDAARACLDAIEAPAFGFRPLQIVAADTLIDVPTMEALDGLGAGIAIDRAIPGHASCYDCSAARDVIGWEPQYSWRTS